jgi:excisionase family DNA binding protein
MEYVSPREAAKRLAVHVETLRRWEADGKITAIKLKSGHRRYAMSAVEKLAGEQPRVNTVLYARVSTNSQRDDLQRQVDFLKSKYPEAEIISEVGSGLNYRRRKFLSILERVFKGNIQQIVVAYPDRLVRFGFELVKWVCEKHECQILVLNDSKLSPHEELVQDILSILHCFSSRLYGLRKYEKQVRQEKESITQTPKEPDEVVAKQCSENTGVSI